MPAPDGFKTKLTVDTQRRCAYFENVGEVYKTAYKKGVIKEFKKIQDDPIQVDPLVRVEVDGQRSDFIPIFFRPKEKYWDTDDASSQSFNEDEGYYENAWMSFRCDDEVIVQCYEDNPVAVIGFADGIPRIGEAIIALEGQTIKTASAIELYFDTLSQDFYSKNAEIGYDDKDLKLLYPCDIIVSETQQKNPVGDTWLYDACRSSVTYSVELGPIRIEDGSSSPDAYGAYQVRTYQSARIKIEGVTAERRLVTPYVGKTHHFLVCVGPLLFVFQFLTSATGVGTWERRSGALVSSFDNTIGGDAEGYLWQLTRMQGYNSVHFRELTSDETYPFTIPDQLGAIVAGRVMTYDADRLRLCEEQNIAEAAIFSNEGGRVKLVEIAAAVYTKDLYNRIVTAAASNHPSKDFVGSDASRSPSEFYKDYPEMIRQLQWRDSLDVGNEALIAEGDATYEWQYRGGNARWTDGIDMDTVDMYVRPHTKEDIEQYLGVKNG